MEKSENLVESLNNTKKTGYKYLGKKIIKQRKRKVFDVVKDSRRENKIDGKLYSILFSFMDKETVLKLKSIESQIEGIINSIEKESGWSIKESGAQRFDNFENMDDPEFRTWDTYNVNRNVESGFYVDTAKPFNSYFASLREEELNFFNKYKNSLDELHRLWIEKYNIINYYSYDYENSKLAKDIIEYLGIGLEDKVIGKQK